MNRFDSRVRDKRIYKMMSTDKAVFKRVVNAIFTMLQYLMSI